MIEVQVCCHSSFSSFIENYQNYIWVTLLPEPNITAIPKKEKRELRESICAAIFNSTYFLEQSMYYIDPNEKIVEREDSIFLNSPTTKFTKQFRYKERTITTRKNQSIDDLMFLCTVWNITGDIMEIYYVSREYRSPNMTTRFVFGYNEHKEIVVLGAAERPVAYVTKSTSMLTTHHQNVFTNSVNRT